MNLEDEETGEDGIYLFRQLIGAEFVFRPYLIIPIVHLARTSPIN